MTTITESKTEADSDSFIKDDHLRVNGGIITEIESVEKTDIRGLTNSVKIYVSEPEDIGPWKYDEPKIMTWDEDKCWLVEFAKKRGYGLENIDMMEGEEVYVEPNEDSGNWSLYTEYPSEMFDEDEIKDSVQIESRETIDRREEVSEDKDIEKDCMQYETVGNYFVCEIDKLVEVERDGACNIIEVTVDTPYDEGVWEFKKPYGWDEDNPLVKLCESRNYGRGNFTSIAGDEVLVARNGNEWTMDTNPPQQYKNNKTTQEKTSDGSRRSAVYMSILLILSLVFIAMSVFLI